jgi:inosine-uridine nucleoside N-ribohydrolase
MHYWIDTDPGLDDALAILLSIREVGGDLVGLSSVQGNGDEPLMAHNLLRVLTTYQDVGVFGASWRPTIARGARGPLDGGTPVRAEVFHGPDCLGGLPWIAGPHWTARLHGSPAAVVICEAVRTLDDLHLVCIGPLSNLALALQLDPELPSRVAGLTIMGGSLRTGGNHTLAAEFNFLADPEAASQVLEAGFKNVALVPLDVCDDARLLASELERIDSIGSQVSRTARDLLRYFETRSTPERGVPFYDPTAWLLTTLPEVAQWEDIYVAVDTGHSVGRGASLADWRGRSGRRPNVRAATRLLDRPAFIEHFLALLA